MQPVMNLVCLSSSLVPTFCKDRRSQALFTFDISERMKIIGSAYHAVGESVYFIKEGILPILIHHKVRFTKLSTHILVATYRGAKM